MSQSDQPQSMWWGQLSLESGQTAQWQIGSLSLAVQRFPNEWRIAYDRDESASPDVDTWTRTLPGPDIDQLDFPTIERYAFSQTDQVLGLMPILADRPVITRPLMPLVVPAKEEATVFVSSPLWVCIEVGDPPKRLQEIPILHSSDTWFGPSTMEGELCYASRTCARLSLENIPIRSHRAVTKVSVHNQADSQLSVERLNLPVPYLSLFESRDGLLWTQAVTMMRTQDTEMATFQVEKDPPAEAKDARPLRGPRQLPEQSMIIRAFGTIFASRMGGD